MLMFNFTNFVIMGCLLLAYIGASLCLSHRSYIYVIPDILMLDFGKFGIKGMVGIRE